MDAVVKTFIDLVRIDSPSGEEEKVADFVVSGLKPYSKVEKDKFGNVYACIEGTGESIFMSAHMDTVEPGRGIDPIIKDGTLIPKGNTILGADDKAALAPMLEMMKSASKAARHAPVELLITRFEETGSYGAANFDYKRLKAKRGFCFDTVNCTIGTIISSSPIYESFDIEIIGKESHASTPELANNALIAFASFVKDIRLGAVSKDTRANIGIVTCGGVRNTIPGKVLAKGEVRSLKEESIRRYKDAIDSALLKQKSERGIEYKTNFVRENGGYDYHPGDKGWKLVEYASKKLEKSGIKTNITTSWGCSDANVFVDKGLECINLGNSVMNPHTNKEKITVADLNKLYSVMMALISP